MLDTAQQQVPQQTTKSENFRSLYSNNVSMTITPWDVVFAFGENQSVKDSILLVELHTRIVMSPQHAKIFSQVLATQISKYEETFGPISIPNQPIVEKTEGKKPS